MKRIDKRRALSLLRKARDERGAEFKYFDEFPREIYGSTCKNVIHGSPACIVGLALSYVVPVEEIPQEGAISYIAHYDIADKVKFSPNALSILRTAQHIQDAGSSWGVAVSRAEERASSL